LTIAALFFLALFLPDTKTSIVFAIMSPAIYQAGLADYPSSPYAYVFICFTFALVWALFLRGRASARGE